MFLCASSVWRNLKSEINAGLAVALIKKTIALRKLARFGKLHGEIHAGPGQAAGLMKFLDPGPFSPSGALSIFG